MRTGKQESTLHYQKQRDLLVAFLRKTQTMEFIGNILGISRSAMHQQFKPKTKGSDL